MIKSSAPKNYVCPICLGVQQKESPDTLMRPSDIVYKDELVTGFINSFFMGKNAGHIILVPNKHFESIYTLPAEYGHRIFDVTQKVALAMKKAYQCDGITTRQNNEPAGDQHAFHFHFHIFPRYVGDGYNAVQPSEKRLAEPEERKEYAEKIKTALKELQETPNSASLHGDIIEESLADSATLKTVHIISTRVEPVTPKHKTPWLKQWTLHTIEVPESEAAATAERLSNAIETNNHNWYIDFKNASTHYVIFPGKVFKVDRSQPEQYKPVVSYGVKLGVPRYQLDFSPAIKYWERPKE